MEPLKTNIQRMNWIRKSKQSIEDVERTVKLWRHTEDYQQNAVLKNLKELKTLTKSNNHLYEIIPEHLPRYFFMDIDIKKEELTEEEKSYLEKNDIIEKLKEAMSAVFEVDISDVVVLQSKSPSTEKLSIHT